MHRPVSADELATALTPLAEARRIASELARPLAAEDCSVMTAQGRTLADDVVSLVDVPPFDNSAMDGYAVRANDCTVGQQLLPIASIATGMPIPDGAEAIVPWEHVVDGVLQQPVQRGQFVRTTGHDVRAGTIVLRAGTTLDAVALGVCSAVGIERVRVIAQPRIGVLITGDELAAPGTAMDGTAVYDSNTAMISALLQRQGIEHTFRRAPDDPGIIRQHLAELSERCDLIVTTGGASVGERDWVRTVVGEQGTLHLWRVAVRPGKPVGLATLRGTPVVVLPGNPGSVLACMHMFVRPITARLRGASAQPVIAHLALASDVVNDTERPFVCPIGLTNGAAAPLIGSTSQGIAHAVGLFGFIVVEAHSSLRAGATVTVEVSP